MTITSITLPTQNELPCDDGIPMETQRHKMQMDLLIHTLYPWLEQRNQGYIGGNMFIYYSAAQLKNQDFKGPDFFAVLDVPKVERKSWVVWEEGKAPDVIVELLSESTANDDKTKKKQIYQDQMRVPEYFWYDPFNSEDLAGFRLHGRIYQPISWEDKGYFCEGLQLYLTRWEGNYEGVTTTWLRWADFEGNVLPTRGEMAQQAQAEKEKLATKLREMGVDPDAL
ncbi:MAG: hypothetical protein BRC33_00750 [Cyanobacteria bacterium SW_9_44_58]|nr:MAG: hypothetical protein BRC33_00750 [Cyanobacteria bacterium SW_9_44_58]